MRLLTYINSLRASAVIVPKNAVDRPLAQSTAEPFSRRRV